MTEQEKAVKMLDLLKATGVSQCAFAKRAGMKVKSLYVYRSCPAKMPIARAKYIISQIKENYPKEWQYITKEFEKIISINEDSRDMAL